MTKGCQNDPSHHPEIDLGSALIQAAPFRSLCKSLCPARSYSRKFLNKILPGTVFYV